MPGAVDCCAVFLFQRVGHHEFSAEKGQGVRSPAGAEPFSWIVGEICNSGSVVCHVAVVVGCGISLAASVDIADRVDECGKQYMVYCYDPVVVSIGGSGLFHDASAETVAGNRCHGAVSRGYCICVRYAEAAVLV